MSGTHHVRSVCAGDFHRARVHRGLRREAFERFEALPIPSQETEEWRYTDLSELDLSFRPHAPGPRAGRARRRGRAAGVQLQHNSSVAMTTSNQDLEARA